MAGTSNTTMHARRCKDYKTRSGKTCRKAALSFGNHPQRSSWDDKTMEHGGDAMTGIPKTNSKLGSMYSDGHKSMLIPDLQEA